MSLAGFTLALVLTGTPLASTDADLPQIVATEQAGSTAVAPSPAQPVALPPCPQGAAFPSAPSAPLVRAV